ncbi:MULTISPECIES: hypothetical protein [Actinomycetes]|uniref:hypothetical protein n=1 Tax=Actinomycetes TaxID=1760 RepID=UPI003433F565
MNDETTYEELMERCGRLANIIVRNNNATEMLLRAEVKKAKAKAWDEAVKWYVEKIACPRTCGDCAYCQEDDTYNPYKEQS